MDIKILSAYIIVCLVWGSTYLAIKIGVESFPAFWFAGLRFILAGFIMYLYLLIRKTFVPKNIIFYIPILITGILLLVFGNGLVVWSEQYITSSLAALIAGTVPIWMALLTGLLLKSHKTPFLLWLGILIGFMGMIILVFPGLISWQFESTKGLPTMFLAAICWSFGSIYTARVGYRYDPIVLTTFQMLFGGMILIIIALLTQPFRPMEIHISGWLSFGYLVLFGSCLTLPAYIYLMANASPAWASTYAYINPVIAVLLGFLILKEPITWNILLGGLIVLTGTGLVNWTQFSLKTKKRNQS